MTDLDNVVADEQEGTMSTETQSGDEAPSVVRKRPGWLMLFIIFAVVGNILAVFYTWASVQNYAILAHPLVIVAGMFNVLGAVSAIAIYKWKRWGVYGYLASLGIITIINLSNGAAGMSLQVLIPLIFLFSAVQPVWHQLE